MTTPASLTEAQINAYRTDGSIHVPAIISKEQAATFSQAALELQRTHLEKETADSDRPVFTQMVNVWQESETMEALTLHPNVAAVATRLAGVPLRLWHDQTLIKKPHNNAPTEFHQDQPYWPHANSPNPVGLDSFGRRAGRTRLHDLHSPGPESNRPACAEPERCPQPFHHFSGTRMGTPGHPATESGRLQLPSWPLPAYGHPKFHR